MVRSQNNKEKITLLPNCSVVLFSLRKLAYIILTPLKPHFYIVKLGYTGVYIIFLISAQNIDCGYSLEAVLTSTHNLCFEQKNEKISEFLSDFFFFFFLVVNYQYI